MKMGRVLFAALAGTFLAAPFGPASAQQSIRVGELNSYKAQPAFLEPYKKGLDQARSIYEGVLRDVDALDGENGGSASAGAEPAAGGLAREAEEQIRAADRDERLTNSACFLSPDACQQNDPADKALQDEIASLLNGTLVAGGPDGGLSVYSLRRKAGLLALRARVMAAVTQRAWEEPPS